ncbi:MAG: alpha-L-glutamate ligase-like protein [Thioalkalispiraceae bacterium]|jgi:alpha-L-glutamate ligase-like protein
MFALSEKLQRNGVLGINQRNADFILPHNPRYYYPRVDDKAETKKLAIAAKIATPELYYVIEIERQVKELPRLLECLDEFVIKPACGSRGDGIVVITGRRKEMYRKASGLLIKESELQYHVSNILSGMYSLGGQSDKCLIEYRVRFDPLFSNITYLGVPDIRTIVFYGIPIMAMVRLPTQMSDGKANLHQGAIGAGIDLGTGKTIEAVWRNEIISEHPDTGIEVSGLQIPHWDMMLDIAARCYEMTGLGFQGIDLVLDRDRGPLMLEINARPGLNIQIANNCGLLHRLKKAQDNLGSLNSINEKITFAKEHFAVLTMSSV